MNGDPPRGAGGLLPRGAEARSSVLTARPGRSQRDWSRRHLNQGQASRRTHAVTRDTQGRGTGVREADGVVGTGRPRLRRSQPGRVRKAQTRKRRASLRWGHPHAETVGSVLTPLEGRGPQAGRTQHMSRGTHLRKAGGQDGNPDPVHPWRPGATPGAACVPRPGEEVG